MFTTYNHASFHLLWKEKLLKYYVHHCLQNFLLLSMSLLTASIVEKSNFLAEIYLIFLKNVLDQTWKSSDAKFWSHWKDWKSSCQVRQNLALSRKLVALILGWNCVKGLIVTKFVKENQVWRSLERVISKKLFPETTMDKIFEKSSSFHVK